MVCQIESLRFAQLLARLANASVVYSVHEFLRFIMVAMGPISICPSATGQETLKRCYRDQKATTYANCREFARSSGLVGRAPSNPKSLRRFFNGKG